MRRLLYLFCLAAIALTSFSCEEEFSPKAPYNEQYVLNCIIRATGSVTTVPLVATLYKTYTINGYDPMENTIDPAIIGADIKIYHKGFVYKMRDTSIVRTDSSRYKTPKTFYAYTGIKFDAGDSVKIVATLNNGVVLSSAIKVPPSFSFKVNKYTINPLEETKEGKIWRISWDNYNNLLLFAPKFYFQYYVKENGVDVYHRKEIPVRYYEKNGAIVPYYPVISKSTNIAFRYEVFDSVMTQISFNDPDKNRYKVGYPIFEVITMDENLAAYYSISNGYMDDVSIRLDEGEYSNIKGGLGIFGATYTSSSSYIIDEYYIGTFGYALKGS